jgi:MATE family multidrug resistance protein
VAWVYAGAMVILFLAGAPLLVRVFSRGFTSGDAAILPLAQTLLRLAAVYTLADSTQVIFAGALRGAGDTTWVMIVSGILHWAVAIAAFILIRLIVVPPVVVWLFFIGFVISLGVAMFLRHRGGAWQRIRLVEQAPPGSQLDMMARNGRSPT